MKNKEKLNWFKSIPYQHWLEASKNSAERKILTPRERSFLYSMGKLSRQNNEPSPKQLDYAPIVYEKVSL